MSSLIGLEVKHKVYGDGTIVDLKNSTMMYVAFNSCKDLKKFRFPDAFDSDFMRLKNNTILVEQYKNELENAYALRWLDGIGIDYLIHFTDITNIGHILSSGYLKSRALLNDSKETFFDGSNHDVIEHTKEDIKHYVRFFYREKTPTLYKSEGIKLQDERDTGHRAIPVALIFDRNMMFHRGVCFLDGSGSSKITKRVNSINAATRFNWSTILKRGPHSEDELYDSANPDISKRKIINHRNAEFLYPNKVDLFYLKSIAFRTSVDMERMILEYGYDSRFEVNRRYFDCNNNFLDVWDVTISDKIIIDFIFNNDNYYKYKLKLVLKFRQGDNKEIDITPEKQLDDLKYTIKLKPQIHSVSDICRIEFYMDDILSAIWEKEE